MMRIYDYKHAIKIHGLSVIARRLGRSKSTVHRWNRGKVEVMVTIDDTTGNFRFWGEIQERKKGHSIA